MQACDIEDDGLYSFDVHSDGDGRRYLDSHFLMASLRFIFLFFLLKDSLFFFFFYRHLNASVKESQTDGGLSSNGSAVGDFPPKQSSYSCIQMNGQEVFRFAVKCVPQSLESALQKAGLPASSIDWLLLHQVTFLIIPVCIRRAFEPEDG